MRVFIVHAHPEPMSFSGAMTRTATAALADAGHEVVVSDLYAIGFNPVSGRHNFTTVSDPDYYRQQAEEAHAATHDGFAPELQREMDHLFWCDALVVQFPLWWFGLPAILKGWVDRVFASGGRVRIRWLALSQTRLPAVQFDRRLAARSTNYGVLPRNPFTSLCMTIPTRNPSRTRSRMINFSAM